MTFEGELHHHAEQTLVAESLVADPSSVSDVFGGDNLLAMTNSDWCKAPTDDSSIPCVIYFAKRFKTETPEMSLTTSQNVPSKLPTKDQKSKTIARALWENFIVHYVFPSCFVSNHGRDFESKTIRELCTLMGADKVPPRSILIESQWCLGQRYARSWQLAMHGSSRKSSRDYISPEERLDQRLATGEKQNINAVIFSFVT